MSRRVAVVLFNLGGPDGPEAVRPFLYNLFRDPAIIGAPGPIRLALAQLISRTREKSAKANYALMGGGSPLLPETRKQAEALSAALAGGEDDVRVFIAMRYWKPLTRDTAAEVAAFAPDEIVLLPLYPQFSTTTTGSSLREWYASYTGPGRTVALCCYPDEPGLVAAHAQLIERTIAEAGDPANLRVLFSAHGLPERVVQQGDPYQAQVEATVAAVVARIGRPIDWRISYQSRVGPLKWIGPATDAEIEATAREGRPLLVCPIAFVSEHVETLVELDHEYRTLAEQAGCPQYLRVPALGTAPAFIEGLAAMVRTALARPARAESACGGRWCPERWSRCPAERRAEAA